MEQAQIFTEKRLRHLRYRDFVRPAKNNIVEFIEITDDEEINLMTNRIDAQGLRSNGLLNQKQGLSANCESSKMEMVAAAAAASTSGTQKFGTQQIDTNQNVALKVLCSSESTATPKVNLFKKIYD